MCGIAKKELRYTTIDEILITVLSLGWGLTLLFNDKTFDQSDNFEILEKIVGNEWVVGVVCLSLAFIKIIGMVFQLRRVRWIGLVLSAIFWVLVSTAFLLSVNEFTINTGFIVYSVIAVLCLTASKGVLIDGSVK